MIVLQLSACPPGIRGDITKWMMEISTGVYVGQLSLRARENLWDRLCKHLKTGSAVMVYSARNEQGFDFRVYNASWEPVDFDGITLMRRPCSNQATGNTFEATETNIKEGSHAKLLYQVSPKGIKKEVTADKNIQESDSHEKYLVSDDGKAVVLHEKPREEEHTENHTESASPRSNYHRRRQKDLPYEPWPENEPYPSSFTVLDMETTGLDQDQDAIIEIACVRVCDGIVSEQMQYLVQCDRPLTETIRTLTGISDRELSEQGIPLENAVRQLLEFIEKDWIVGHNIAFDIGFLLAACKSLGISSPPLQAIDTVHLARHILGGAAPGFKLETLVQYLQIADRQVHRALPDALLTAGLYLKLNEIASTAN